MEKTHPWAFWFNSTFSTGCKGVWIEMTLRGGFPGEIFRVLKDKEMKQFGDALRKTRRLVLEAWDKMQEA